MTPALKDEVVARVEQNGVMVERKGVVVGRSIECRERVRYDVLFPDERDNLKRIAVNVPASNVRKA